MAQSEAHPPHPMQVWLCSMCGKRLVRLGEFRWVHESDLPPSAVATLPVVAALGPE